MRALVSSLEINGTRAHHDARVRNIRVPSKDLNGIKNTFTLEVDITYQPILPFLIATSLAIDEYSYRSSITEKEKNCD